MARVLGFLIRYFSNYYTLHRSDLTARAAPVDPRLLKADLNLMARSNSNHTTYYYVNEKLCNITTRLEQISFACE